MKQKIFVHATSLSIGELFHIHAKLQFIHSYYQFQKYLKGFKKKIFRFPKKSYSIKTVDSSGLNNVLATPMSFPIHYDWVLYGGGGYQGSMNEIFLTRKMPFLVTNLFFADPSYLKNYLMYNVARQVGDYATRTQFCEVFIKESPTQSILEQYRGVFLFEEKIERDPNRVNIEKATNLPDTSYIFAQDKVGKNDIVIPARCPCNILKYPKSASTDQQNFVKGKMNSLCDTNSGVSSVINMTSWANVWIHEEFCVNIDSFGEKKN